MTKVTLIGDSIRMGYLPFVAERLGDEYQVWGPETNGGTSENVLNHLQKWIIDRQSNIVHVNAGLHDILGSPEAARMVEMDAYAANVREILRRTLEQTTARVIWATTTPVIEDRICRWYKQDPPLVMRREKDVIRYNAAACEVAGELGVEINDLCAVIEAAGVTQCLRDDGVHMTEIGNARLSEAICRLLDNP